MKKRKNLRIKDYNYSNEGYYFITICVEKRKCILSKIEHNETTDSAEVILSQYGMVVEYYIQTSNAIYRDIKIEDYVIMPNHIHFICSILHRKFNKCNNPQNRTLPAFVSAFKRLTNKYVGEKIWQRNYYEHIIRNEKEYLEILEYIEFNPIKWELDDYYEKT